MTIKQKISTYFVYTCEMNFDWDENKRQINLDKHGLDFWDAWQVLAGCHVVAPSNQCGEEVRFLATGELNSRMVTVVYAQRGDTLRVISFRRARDNEKRNYTALLAGRTEGTA